MSTLQEYIQGVARQAGFAVAGVKRSDEQIQALKSQIALLEIANREAANKQDRVLAALQKADALRGAGDPAGGVMSKENVRYIETIPGRRVPFDLIFTLPIPNNSTQTVQATYTIPQEGPFIAVRRSVTFLSQHTFRVTSQEEGESGTFQGRSFGRFRPAHSAWDLNDAAAGVPIGVPTGTGEAIYASPSTQSPFRTMQFDGFLEFVNQGTSYPRQNVPVPTSFFTESINEPFDLAALDFFERGETLQLKVQPSHVNNPPFGNAFGIAGSFPFSSAQYDVQEGIRDVSQVGVTEDPVTRSADGILLVVYHGYRIIQPPGPVAL